MSSARRPRTARRPGQLVDGARIQGPYTRNQQARYDAARLSNNNVVNTAIRQSAQSDSLSAVFSGVRTRRNQYVTARRMINTMDVDTDDVIQPSQRFEELHDEL